MITIKFNGTIAERSDYI